MVVALPALADVEVFQPFGPARFHLGRVAVRSGAFSGTSASGGRDVLIGSAAGADADDVRVRAHGELVERVSNVVAGRRAEHVAEICGSYDRLRRRGLPLVDPAMWPQYARSVAQVRSLAMLWVWGQYAGTSADAVLVPASAVFLHHRPPPGCGLMLRVTSTGLAAGSSREQATEHAFGEVVERDLLCRCWYLGQPATRLDASAVPPPTRTIVDQLELGVDVFQIAGAGATCVVAALHDRHGRQQSFGARCFVGVGDLAPAVTVAVGEALMVRWSMGTSFARRTWRRLLDSAGGEPADVTPKNPLEHAVIAYFGASALGEFDRRCAGHGGSRYPAPASVERLSAGAIVVDTGVPLATGDPTDVVRVLIPGALDLPTDAAGRPHPFG